MNRPNRPVWELVGMDQMTYSHLPYKTKQVLMRRAGYPIKIRDVNDCIQQMPRFSTWAIPAFNEYMADLIRLLGRDAAYQYVDRHSRDI